MTSNIPGSDIGLSSAQVPELRIRFGSNLISPPPRTPWWREFFAKFDDPVIRILMLAAAISLPVGMVAEGLAILLAVFLATSIAFWNEYRANREFAVMNQVNDEQPIKTYRDGVLSQIPRKELVVGDVVVLEAGEACPADGSVLECISLAVDESPLTGESLPVGKAAEASVFRGTFVVEGHGKIQITAVGDQTEIGKVARESMSDEMGESTPLQVQLGELSRWIGVVGFSVAGILFLALVIRAMVLETIVLSSAQWAFALWMLLTAALGLSKVWLPVLLDGLAMTGLSLKTPEWIENSHWTSWMKVVGTGLGLWGLGLALGIGLDLWPSAPHLWMPSDAIRQFLSFFMLTVTLIVVAVPEGLAMSVTLSLAYSMRRLMACRNLVRRLHACETIGAATVICTDKTGTLTQNKMAVGHAVLPPWDLRLERVGQGGGNETFGQLFAEALSVNSSAHLSSGDGNSLVILGNPTEGALLVWLKEKGEDYEAYRKHFVRTGQTTFSSLNKFMATSGRSAILKGNVVFLKGAPEVVLKECRQAWSSQGDICSIDEERDSIERLLNDFQKKGFRTLGFAFRLANGNDSDLKLAGGSDPGGVDGMKQSWTWMGMVAMSDPLRGEVFNALESCRRAGVQVKMITGDVAPTALEIGRQIQLVEEKEYRECHLSGADLEGMTDEALMERLPRLKVLSRAKPLDKLRVVRLLQKQGHVVAVTGDGVNDAPALNHAHVGLAMGRSGSSVARDASDIILLDDAFSSIVEGILWGRSLFRNIQRFIVFQLTINFTALSTALLGPFIGIEMPFTVLQMLWINLIMDSLAALALATEPANPVVMSGPPRNKDEFIVSRTMMAWIFGVGSLFLLGVIVALRWIQADHQVEIQELSLFFTMFVLAQLWNLFNVRCLGSNRSFFSSWNQNNYFTFVVLAILVGQIAIVQWGGSVFRTTPLSLSQWITLLLGTSLVFWIGEGFRAWSRLVSARPHSIP